MNQRDTDARIDRVLANSRRLSRHAVTSGQYPAARCALRGVTTQLPHSVRFENRTSRRGQNRSSARAA